MGSRSYTVFYFRMRFCATARVLNFEEAISAKCFLVYLSTMGGLDKALWKQCFLRLCFVMYTHALIRKILCFKDSTVVWRIMSYHDVTKVISCIRYKHFDEYKNVWMAWSYSITGIFRHIVESFQCYKLTE